MLKNRHHYWMEAISKLTHVYWENDASIGNLRKEIKAAEDKIVELQSHNEVISEQFGKGLQIKYIPMVEDLTEEGIRKYVGY